MLNVELVLKISFDTTLPVISVIAIVTFSFWLDDITTVA
jgi:hypothetical protein